MWSSQLELVCQYVSVLMWFSSAFITALCSGSSHAIVWIQTVQALIQMNFMSLSRFSITVSLTQMEFQKWSSFYYTAKMHQRRVKLKLVQIKGQFYLCTHFIPLKLTVLMSHPHWVNETPWKELVGVFMNPVCGDSKLVYSQCCFQAQLIGRVASGRASGTKSDEFIPNRWVNSGAA